MKRVFVKSLRVALLLAILLSAAPAHAEPDGAGSISGRVTDLLTGAPIADVTVQEYGTSAKVTTDADGRYRLDNVPEGQRYVRFDHPRYVSEYYGDAPRLFLATPVTVVAGQETAGINAALGPGGRIRGRVTDRGTGAPLEGVRVQAQLPDLQPWWPWRTVRDAVTDADGRYAIEGLWTTVYQVEFVDEAGDHATQGYGENVGVLTGEDATGIDAAMEHEGHIAGQVTDLITGEPLAGVAVVVLGPEDDGYVAARVETDADGRYEATSLRAGQYWLHFEPRDKLHAARYYGGEDENAWESQSVRVEVGRTTGGVDQPLPQLSAITGRVTDAVTGAGLRGMAVYLDQYSEYRAPDATTRPDGSYIIPGDGAGRHTVWVHDPGGKYRDGQAIGLDGEDGTVTVQEGRVSREVNAALTPWSVSLRKITGTVTDVVTGQPLAGIAARLVYCYRDGHRWECDGVGGATTDSQGRYEIHNPDGRAARLTFSDPSGAYLAQDAADFRSPGEDEVVVIDMALQRYDRVYGAIVGRVMGGGTGEPLATQYVCADNVTGANQGCAFTGADGTYKIEGLKAGQYKVGFGLWNKLGDRYSRWYYGGDAEGTNVAVTVKPNEFTSNIDAALPENGRVTGTVYRSDTGGPLANAGVAICTGQDCSYVGSGADGGYAGYAAPGVYRVLAYANGYERRYYRDAPKADLAAPVTVTLNTETPGIDITLPHLGGIAGQVTAAETRAAIGGITVKIFVSENGWYSATTGPDGRYVKPDLASGAYRVRFEDAKGIYAPWETGLVTVTVNMTATVDAALTPNGFVSGRVTAAESGAGLGGIEIRAGSLMLWTNPDGTYTIGPLPDGEYQVRYWDPALLRRMDYSARVMVKAGQTTAGVDHAMILLCVARGRVIDADTGSPIAGVKMGGRGHYSANVPTYTDADGRYELPGLDDGTYSITADERTDRYVDGQSVPVTMVAGTTVDVPDIKLKKWGELGGTVTDAHTGAPVAGVWVTLHHSSDSGEWYIWGYGMTGADGTYRIRGLYDATARPVFYDPQARFHAQSYGGGQSLLDGQTVTFKRGADTLGVDAALVLNMRGQPFPTPTRTPEAPEPEQERVWLPVVVGE